MGFRPRLYHFKDLFPWFLFIFSGQNWGLEGERGFTMVFPQVKWASEIYFPHCTFSKPILKVRVSSGYRKKACQREFYLLNPKSQADANKHREHRNGYNFILLLGMCIANLYIFFSYIISDFMPYTLRYEIARPILKRGYIWPLHFFRIADF